MQSVIESEGSEEVCIVLSHNNLQRAVTITVRTQPGSLGIHTITLTDPLQHYLYALLLQVKGLTFSQLVKVLYLLLIQMGLNVLTLTFKMTTCLKIQKSLMSPFWCHQMIQQWMFQNLCYK